MFDSLALIWWWLGTWWTRICFAIVCSTVKSTILFAVWADDMIRSLFVWLLFDLVEKLDCPPCCLAHCCLMLDAPIQNRYSYTLKSKLSSPNQLVYRPLLSVFLLRCYDGCSYLLRLGLMSWFNKMKCFEFDARKSEFSFEYPLGILLGILGWRIVSQAWLHLESSRLQHQQDTLPCWLVQWHLSIVLPLRPQSPAINWAM